MTESKSLRLCWTLLLFLLVHVTWLIGLSFIGIITWSVIDTLQNYSWNNEPAQVIFGMVLIVLASSCLCLSCIVFCCGIFVQLCVSGRIATKICCSNNEIYQDNNADSC